MTDDVSNSDGLGGVLGDLSILDDKAPTPSGDDKAQGADDGSFLSDLGKVEDGESSDESKGEQGQEQEKEAETVIDPKEYDWTPPEDFKDKWEQKGEAGEAEFSEFKEYAQKNGIKGEVFKTLMDKYASNAKNITSGLEQSLAKEWDETVSGWEKAIRQDPEVGGKNYLESRKSAVTAIKEFGGKQLADELLNTGFGNNPILFKAFARAGHLLQEGNFSNGKPAVEKKPIYEQIYNQ